MTERLFTELMLTKLRPLAGETRSDFWDKAVPGFGVRVSDTGLKAFIVMFRAGKSKRRMTLGRYPSLKLADARNQAREAMDLARAGIDPIETARQRAAAEEAKAPALTVKGLVDDFIEIYAKPKNRDWRNIELMLGKHVTRVWEARAANDISRRDCVALLDAVMKGSAPIGVNRLHTALTRMFRWAASRDMIDVNPMEGVEKPAAERSRDRVLSPAELVEIWKACDSVGQPFGPMVKLLMTTLQRRDEVAEMQRSEVDGQTWTLPGERSKNGRANVVHLSALSLDALAAMPIIDGSKLVFSTTGNSAVSGFSRAKRRLDKQIAKNRLKAAEKAGTSTDDVKVMPHWTLHDLRRSGVTHMAEILTVPPHIADKILNHSTGTIQGVAAIYNRSAYQAERKDALNAWGRYLDSLLGIVRADQNVVDIAQRRA